MSGLKDLAKGGWHPKGKDGGKESWRGDFKGINQIVRPPVMRQACMTADKESLTAGGQIWSRQRRKHFQHGCRQEPCIDTTPVT